MACPLAMRCLYPTCGARQPSTEPDVATHAKRRIHPVSPRSHRNEPKITKIKIKPAVPWGRGCACWLDMFRCCLPEVHLYLCIWSCRVCVHPTLQSCARACGPTWRHGVPPGPTQCAACTQECTCTGHATSTRVHLVCRHRWCVVTAQWQCLCLGIATYGYPVPCAELHVHDLL